MTDNLIPLLASGGVAVLLTNARFARAARAAGVPIPAHVTSAQSAAVVALPRVAGVPYTSTRPAEFTERWNDIKRGLSALRGFRVVGGRSYTQFTGADYREVIAAFIAAVRAGVRDGGYRVTAAALFGVGVNGEAALDQILEAAEMPKQTFMGVELAGVSPFSFTLTPLGAAVRAAELERRRVGFAVAQDHPRTDEVIYSLVLEMDEAGYLITGRPQPNPRIADGIAHAADVTVKTVAGGAAKIAGNLGGAVVGAALRSSLFWALGLGLVAFKVMR